MSDGRVLTFLATFLFLLIELNNACRRSHSQLDALAVEDGSENLSVLD